MTNNRLDHFTVNFPKMFQVEINKEIIRRLRIQNKKLIEHVTKLKEETKKMNKRKVLLIDHLNELMRLVAE